MRRFSAHCGSICEVLLSSVLLKSRFPLLKRYRLHPETAHALLSALKYDALVVVRTPIYIRQASYCIGDSRENYFHVAKQYGLLLLWQAAAHNKMINNIIIRVVHGEINNLYVRLTYVLFICCFHLVPFLFIGHEPTVQRRPLHIMRSWFKGRTLQPCALGRKQRTLAAFTAS